MCPLAVLVSYTSVSPLSSFTPHCPLQASSNQSAPPPFRVPYGFSALLLHWPRFAQSSLSSPTSSVFPLHCWESTGADAAALRSPPKRSDLHFVQERLTLGPPARPLLPCALS
eukprot:GGOE01029306.1.p6 GENE.GGOE01029306.1~~GGOE01029306.1.p6  ORF type:complete len:113 (+),score=2.74 GGOE01029306.1:614-952(+)